jgi:hypothetical protein
MDSTKNKLSRTWRSALEDKRFRIVFFISVITLALTLFFLTQFLEYAESREGFLFTDPLHGYFKAVDLTWIIFAVIYLSLAAAVVSLLPHPSTLLFALQLYTAMVLVRIGAMYLLPLEAPEGMIILQDPFVEFFGSGETLTKDLFFSGHTASILIFYLTARTKLFRMLFLTLVFLIGALVILQKVHYTIDVYAAVFFTITCYYFIKLLKDKFNI